MGFRIGTRGEVWLVINREDSSGFQLQGYRISQILVGSVITEDDFILQLPCNPVITDAGPLAEWGSAVTIGAKDPSVGQLRKMGRVAPQRRFIGL
jgi:hypothetical protein